MPNSTIPTTNTNATTVNLTAATVTIATAAAASTNTTSKTILISEECEVPLIQIPLQLPLLLLQLDSTINAMIDNGDGSLPSKDDTNNN